MTVGTGCSLGVPVAISKYTAGGVSAEAAPIAQGSRLTLLLLAAVQVSTHFEKHYHGRLASVLN